MHGLRTARMSVSSGLDPGFLHYEVATLFGTAVLPTLVYGINSTLIFVILCLLWKGRTADTRKRTIVMTGYIALICALSTAHWMLSCVGAGLSLVEVILTSNMSPFEPSVGIYFVLTVATNLAVDVIYTILTCLTDGLLVRCGYTIRPVLFELKRTLALALFGALCWVQRASALVHPNFVLRPVSFADR